MQKRDFSRTSFIPSRKAAGDFSASELLDTMVMAEEMWSDGAQANQYKSNSESAKAVLNNQTARFKELDDKEHDKTVRVTWTTACGTEVEDCENNCVITEPQMESHDKDYKYDMCGKTGFSINRETLRTNTYTREQLAAQGTARAIKALDEWWSKQILLKLSAFAGINVAPSPYTFNSTDMTTEVPANQYNLNMLSNIMKQATLNQMNSPYYIEKGDLWVPIQDAKFDAGNFDGKGEAARAQAWKLNIDLFNFVKAGITEDLFAIDQSAVAFKTYNRYPDTPMEMGGKVQQTHYSVDSQLLPGVSYGVIYELTCVNNAGKTEYWDAWRFITEGGIWLNPEACPVVIGGDTYSPNGVLSYSKVV